MNVPFETCVFHYEGCHSRAIDGNQKLQTMDWFKGKFTGKHHISWEFMGNSMVSG